MQECTSGSVLVTHTRVSWILYIYRLLAVRPMLSGRSWGGTVRSFRRQRLSGKKETLVINSNATTEDRGYHNTDTWYGCTPHAGHGDSRASASPF